MRGSLSPPRRRSLLLSRKSDDKNGSRILFVRPKRMLGLFFLAFLRSIGNPSTGIDEQTSLSFPI